MTALLLAALIDISGTVVTLQPTLHPRAEAEIVMENNETNGPQDNMEHMLTMDGLQVSLAFRWDHGTDGRDAVLVTPPDGMICEPISCVLEVLEGQTGTLYLLPWEGM